MLNALLRWLAAWMTGLAHRRDCRRKLRAFPPRSRVLLGGCKCARKHEGRLGTVEGLDSFEEDYRVWVDEDCWPDDEFSGSLTGRPRYDCLCAMGMKLTRQDLVPEALCPWVGQDA